MCASAKWSLTVRGPTFWVRGSLDTTLDRSRVFVRVLRGGAIVSVVMPEFERAFLESEEMVNPNRIVNFKIPEDREPTLSPNDEQATERQRWLAEHELTLGRRRHLLLGAIEPGMEGYSDSKAFCRGWGRHGESLLKEWAHKPCIRPAGYWICDFPHVLEGESTDPLHFGKVVPSLSDQAAILAFHNLLTDAELESMGKAAQTV